jgi:hypothetical protein
MQRLNQSVNNVGEGSIVLNEIRKEFEKVRRKYISFRLKIFIFRNTFKC